MEGTLERVCDMIRGMDMIDIFERQGVPKGLLLEVFVWDLVGMVVVAMIISKKGLVI